MNVLERRESFLRTIGQLTAERAAARPVVESLRASASEVWEKDIPSSWRTAGFVQELTAEASEILESDPRESLRLAQLALAIATSIPAKTYDAPIQAQIEGAAWKEIGTAHRYLSEYDAALRAYDAAHRALATANTLAHDAAVVDFARAIVFADLDRYSEALELLSEVEPIFRGFEDKRRLVQLKTLTGIVYMKTLRLEEARSTFQQALADVPAEDLHTRATILSNLGIVSTDLGDLNNAVLTLHNGLQLYSAMGMTAEVSRCEWSMARVLLQTGEFQKALPMLRLARGFFLEKGMPEEAGLAGLDLADASIATGAVDEARELVSQILKEFTAAKLNDRALTALAYLRDVLPTTPKPIIAVRHVRQYLDRLQREPALLFLPLPD
jgi:tetratricopeptide (TPR) repeat protein